MNCLRLSEKDIQNYINDTGIYHRGRMYYFNGLVCDLQMDDGSITARVCGSRDYAVRIMLDAYHEIVKETCTCPYYKEWKKPCKHICAALLEARKTIELKNIKYRNSNAAVNAIFMKLESAKKSITHGNRERIYLYPSLTIAGQDNSIRACLELRVGVTRPYVVKNAEEFIAAWVNGNRLIYGNQLTLDRSRQYFAGRDELVMDILKDIYTINRELSGLDNSCRYAGLITGRQFRLMPTQLERFLNIMTGESISASINNDDFETVPVVEEALPVTFEVRQIEEWLSVKLGMEKPPFELIQDGMFYYTGDKIYKIPETQQRYLSIIKEGFRQAGKNEVIVPDQFKGRFITEVVPLMKKTGDVMVSPSLKEQIFQAPVKTEVYLDQYGKGISARVVFSYGECRVNPALKEDAVSPERGYILRDIEAEQQVLDYLHQSGFVIEKDVFCLNKKEDIWRFVFERLPGLQAVAGVFYSEDFKKMTVKRRINISGRISLVDDLLDVSFDTKDLDRDELRAILEALRKKKRFFRLKDGAILPLEEYPVLNDLAYLTDQMDIAPKDLEDGVLRMPKYRALYLDSIAEMTECGILEKTREFRHYVETLSSIKNRKYEIPPSLRHILRDYQKVGYQWLKVLSDSGLGGILADDMGLGKTLQVLALILSERAERKAPALVIAPTSLVYNWVMEAEKFTPELKVLAVSGNQPQRQLLLEKMDDYDLVVTSYPLIRRDVEAYQTHRFSFCFIDEAQHVKNHITQSAKAIRKIQARNRFALTGTPMENSLMELWSIFDFIMPSYLFTQQKFQERFVKPIINEESREASIALSRQIRPFILRRMKKDVLKELPEKIETTLMCDLTEAQKDIYLAILAQAKDEIELSIAQNGFEKSQLQILAALTRLRQICCHPSTFIENYEGGSGKLNLLEELMDGALESGHRLLLFSQFTSMLDIIEKELNKKEIPYFYLSGKTAAAERSSIVKRFNEGEGRVFLLSLKAGGTGLTLTGADMVIHYDPWWNPAVEEQATDRAYRIGQEKVVQVFRLITRSTIEEKIQLLQKKKREMIDMVIKPGETMLQKLTKEEIRALFE